MKKLITHDGSFHSDDVFACATLSLWLEQQGKTFEIFRTRDQQMIETGDYVFDVGGVYDPETERFDHHQNGGAGKRENEIEYASFGLVWKKFGQELSGSIEAAEVVEDRLVAPIDAFDNGQDLVTNKSDISPYFIQHFFLSMLPTWREEDLSHDEVFLKCVSYARDILAREIVQARDILLAEKTVQEIYKNTKDKRIVVLDKRYPYEYVIGAFPEPLFVIYPRTNGLYGVKAVRANPKTFKNRKDFPEAWAGRRDEELADITGVPDAVFCHRGRFLAVAKTLEGAKRLAEMALKN